MPDHDELDTRLNGLRAMPPAALPGAAAARARGRQRTRRTRAALAGAGSLLAVLAVSAGAALSSAPDRIVAPPAGGGPSGAVEEEGLTVSLLEAEDVAAVRDETWQVRPTDDLPFDPLPHGCRGEEEVLGTPFASALRFFDGPQPLVAGHSLRAYAEEAAAEAAFTRLIDSAESCSGPSPQYELYGGLPGSGPTRIYGTYVQADFSVDFAVERIGAVLSGVALRSVRPASHLEEMPALADAAAEEVRAGPFVDPEPGDQEPGAAGWDPGSALLSPQDAIAVEEGRWSSEQLADGPLFSPCEGLLEYPRSQSASGTDLQLDRQAGGTRLAHEAYRYATPGEAELVLDTYREAVRACPTENIEDIGEDDSARTVLGSTSYELVEDEPDALLVRVLHTCDTCSPAPAYVAVLRAADGVAVLQVSPGQDADRLDLARRYARLAAERLAVATVS